MATYRKKPVEVEAIQWTGDNVEDILLFLHGDVEVRCDVSSHRLIVQTLDSVGYAYAGDWLIRGVVGEYYPCRGDLFLQTYEDVDVLKAT